MDELNFAVFRIPECRRPPPSPDLGSPSPDPSIPDLAGALPRRPSFHIAGSSRRAIIMPLLRAEEDERRTWVAPGPLLDAAPAQPPPPVGPWPMGEPQRPSFFFYR